MGKYSLQVRADFAVRFQKIPLRTFDNIGTSGRLFVRVDDLINQTMASYEMSEYERFNEFVVFCKKHIFKIKSIEKNANDSFADLKKEIESQKEKIQNLERLINKVAELTRFRFHVKHL